MPTDPQPDRPGQPPATLVAAVRHLLRPLVRGFIAVGIDFPYLVSLLKGVYVEVASKDLAPPGEVRSDSRISLLTGLHRKDVKRLRATADVASPAPRASLNAQIIARWLGAPEYLDANLRPIPLARQASRAEPSFNDLVRSVSTDIRPRSVLEEWLRLGLARLDEEGRVQLNATAFVPREGFDDLAYYFGRNLHDHVAASTHNLLRQGEPFLERAVYYDTLSAESVAVLKETASRVGTEALLALNRTAAERAEHDKSNPAASRRIRFGVYFFETDERSESSGGN